GDRATLPDGKHIWITGGALAFANASGLPESGDVDWRNLDGGPMSKDPANVDWTWLFENSNTFGRPQGLISVRTSGFKNPPRWLGMHVFDARTKYQLGQAKKKRTMGHSGYFGGEFAMWHRAPVIVFVDFAADDWISKTVPFEAGQSVELGDVKIQIQGAVDGNPKRMDYSSGGIERIEFADLQLGGWRGLFHVISDWKSERVAVRDPSGDRYRMDWLEPGNWHLAGFNDGEKPEQLEINYAPTVYRVVFRLDKFPGMPASVVDVDNLFETQIPAFRVETKHDALELLGAMTQMQVTPSRRRRGALLLASENTTPQQLLNSIQPHVNVEVNAEVHELQVNEKEPLLNRLRKKLPF
ncbi:MAG: hypothetical protein AAF585_28640, partial [Verrucomicrobiota bacterium]